MKMGLYANINAKRNRIKAQKAAGNRYRPERMKKPGSKGADAIIAKAEAFEDAHLHEVSDPKP
jgi:hypothetical protein